MSPLEQSPRQPAPLAPAPDWTALTEQSLHELTLTDSVYRPTNFWGPGLEQLLDNMREIGLETFKSWPTAGIWFYPRYGNGFTNASIAATYEAALTANPWASQPFLAGALNGSLNARRDYDSAQLAWDQQRWPYDLTGFGESGVGRPPQAYRLSSATEEVAFGRPYLNYLLCLAALSRHVDTPPRSFLEIGGGFGCLGEIVLSRDPSARYVDLDIPPLLTVSTYYLQKLFGADAVQSFADVPAIGPLTLTGSAVLPNWRVRDVEGPFDVFVNSYSFQEMEPDVVEHYVDAVAAKQVRHVVSLNSRFGKPKAAKSGDWGALEPVTSAMIVALFQARGYTLSGTYDDPLLRSEAQLNVLTRD